MMLDKLALAVEGAGAALSCAMSSAALRLPCAGACSSSVRPMAFTSLQSARAPPSFCRVRAAATPSVAMPSLERYLLFSLCQTRRTPPSTRPPLRSSHSRRHTPLEPTDLRFVRPIYLNADIRLSPTNAAERRISALFVHRRELVRFVRPIFVKNRLLYGRGPVRSSAVDALNESLGPRTKGRGPYFQA